MSVLLLARRLGALKQRSVGNIQRNLSFARPPVPRWHFKPVKPGRGAGTVLLAALGPAAFLELSNVDKDNERGTFEERMLNASRDERRHDIAAKASFFGNTSGRVILWFDRNLYEPIATFLRFFHLVLIFVPVILTVPAIWIGQSVGDNQLTGTVWWYGYLVKAMENAGPAFIKLGQWAASRTDIFPQAMCSIMSSLHSNAPAHSIKQTKEIILKAFPGHTFDEIFEEFDEEPLGVGAIAQVYKAKMQPEFALKQSEDPDDKNFARNIQKNVDVLVKSEPQQVTSSFVAIKVLHPGIERTVGRDLRIMSFVANLLNLIPTVEWLSLPDEAGMFGYMMRLQLDLRIEAANLEMFQRTFRYRTTASFPIPYSENTTRQVLVEEFAEGIPLAAFLEDGGGVFQKDIAEEGLNAFLHMVLIDNFIHADLHPGNIMVRFFKSGKLDILSRFGLFAPNETDSTEKTDVTEEALSRLRPFRRDKEKWEEQLRQLDLEGYHPQLIFIDAGLVSQLDMVNRRNFLDLFKAIAEFDGYKAGHLMVERCRQPDAVIDGETFALKMQHLVLGVKKETFALGKMKIGDILGEVLSMVRTHHVRLEGDFVNVVISILLLEGIGRQLDPDLDIFKR
jgi:aarF domain-containing kinase